MPRPRTRHWRLLILLACLAIALLDAKIDRGRKSLTISWKPTPRLGIARGVRAIERAVTKLWETTPPDAGVRVPPVRIGGRTSTGREKAPPAQAAAQGQPGPAKAPKALEGHSDEDRRRLDESVSGN